MLHVHKPHQLHPHLPHPHVQADFDERPWHMVPVALATIVVRATVLIVVCFELAKAFTGHAY